MIYFSIELIIKIILDDQFKCTRDSFIYARPSPQLEEVCETKEKVRKLTAKIEDLQEILNIKSDMERSLTLEHDGLKQTFEVESKVNKRLSMEIEELQWKLKQSGQYYSDDVHGFFISSLCFLKYHFWTIEHCKGVLDWINQQNLNDSSSYLRGGGINCAWDLKRTPTIENGFSFS